VSEGNAMHEQEHEPQHEAPASHDPQHIAGTRSGAEPEPRPGQEGRHLGFTDPVRQRRITYLVVGVVVLALLVVGLVVQRQRTDDRAAQAKADQLITQFQAAGLPVPSKDLIVGTLGTDGGAVCTNPGNALKKAIRDGLGSNGAAGPGMRPVFIDRELVQGELLILQVYCPDDVAEFQRYVAGLKVADVVRE
jgi:hypothetical protein